MRPGKVCPYCDGITEYVDSKAVYKKSHGMIYLCRSCKAWVGVHEGTNRPLGRLANAELRKAKIRAHAYFDILWKKKMHRGFSKKDARFAGYRWLAKCMNLKMKDTHIGMFDIRQCEAVVRHCRPYVNEEEVCAGKRFN